MSDGRRLNQARIVILRLQISDNKSASARPLERQPQRSAAARTVSWPQSSVIAVTAGPEGLYGVIITPLLFIRLEFGYSDKRGKKNAQAWKKYYFRYADDDLEDLNSDIKSVRIMDQMSELVPA